MEIYLIRHGDCCKAGKENYDPIMKTVNPQLTDIGYKQAEQLAERCSNIKFDRIYSSDLCRAVETATILNNTVRSEVFIDSNFREIDMGDVYLNSWTNYPELFTTWSKHEEDICYPNGENGKMVWDRCKRSIENIVKNDFERIAIVCHGGTIRSIICGILNISQERRFYIGAPPENCSISIIKFQRKEQKFYLHTFNCRL
jgi:broad specificity phosphatase PhoE